MAPHSLPQLREQFLVEEVSDGDVTNGHGLQLAAAWSQLGRNVFISSKKRKRRDGRDPVFGVAALGVVLLGCGLQNHSVLGWVFWEDGVGGQENCLDSSKP